MTCSRGDQSFQDPWFGVFCSPAHTARREIVWNAAECLKQLPERISRDAVHAHAAQRSASAAAKSAVRCMLLCTPDMGMI